MNYEIRTYPSLIRTYLVEAKNEKEAWGKYYKTLPEPQVEEYGEDVDEPEIIVLVD